MKAALALILALIAAPALAGSTPVQQSGNVTPRHAGAWTTNGVMQDAGPATGGFLSELGITKNGGCAFGINSGPTTGPYTQLCEGVTNGTGYLNLQSYGGAPAASFNITVNGVTYPFPGPGNGDVLGPPSSIDGDTAVFNGSGGTLLKDGGPPAFAVPTNAALAAIPLAGRIAGFTVSRNGYFVVGDAPAANYTLQTSACSLNGGLGDGGVQVPSTTSGNCWVLNSQSVYDPQLWGATGSALTAAATGSGTTLALNNIQDFAPGQNIRIPLGGTTPSAAAVTISAVNSRQKATLTGSTVGGVLTASSVSGNLIVGSILVGGVPAGTTITGYIAPSSGKSGTYTISSNATVTSQSMTTVPGTTTYCYQVSWFTADEAIGPASPQVCAGDGAPPTLFGLPYDVASPSQGEGIIWSAATGVTPAGYIIWGGLTGNVAPIGTVDATLTNYIDYHCTATGTVKPPTGNAQCSSHGSTVTQLPSWIPATAPTVAVPGRLLTSIQSVNGNNITLASSSASVSSVAITHDDTIPFQNALTSGLTLQVGSGTYNTTGSLVFTKSFQTVQGADQRSTIIHPYGCYDIMTVNSAATNYVQFGLDGADVACGSAINMLGGSNMRFDTMNFLNTYNGITGTAFNYVKFNELQWQIDHRGQYVVHIFDNSSTTLTELAYFDHFQTAVSHTSIGFHIDGNVASTFIKDGTSVQSMQQEVVIDDAIGYINPNTMQMQGPSLTQLWDTGLNNCDDWCIQIRQGAEQFYFWRPYLQGRAGNQQPTVYADNTVSNVNFFGGDIFGGENGGLELHSFINNVTGAMIFQNSVTVGAFAEIILAGDSVGSTITGGANYPVNQQDNTGTGDLAYVDVRSAATNVQLYPGSWAGRSGCGWTNAAVPANHVTIGGTTKGSPADTVDTVSGGDNLTVAAYPNLYDGVDGLTARICRSGPVAAHNDQLDTAANILASPALTGAAPGTSFNILYSSGVNAIMTLVGNTGITVTAGTAGIPANGGGGNISSVLFHCIVQPGGTTIVCTGQLV